MHLVFFARCLLLLFYFNENLNVSKKENLKTSITKFHENPSDGSDESNIRFLRANAPKMADKCRSGLSQITDIHSLN